MKLSILTATYNHPTNLSGLYDSLCSQEDKDFQWIIVNDGSKDETDVLIRNFIQQNKIVINYCKQSNKGKSASVNVGLDLAKSSYFVVIVDDDEYLIPNATKIIKNAYEKYSSKNCSSIVFTRSDLNGKPLVSTDVARDEFSSFQNRKRRNIFSDGYIGYYINKLTNIRFPIFEGEKYIAPSVLLMLASEHFDILWSVDVIGKTEYLEGGITKQGRKLRLKNPIGMVLYSSLMQHQDSGLKKRLIYSIMAYAYMYYSNSNWDQLKSFGIKRNNFYNVRLLGYCLANYWKIKF